MWISKLKLENFKVYENTVLNFNEPTQGKNIVLIGAINGHGKTSLLEAIYIGLYGKDALPHLERAGLNFEQASSWANWLNGALYHGARDISKRFIEASITIEIRKNANTGVRIRRVFHFEKNNNVFMYSERDDRTEILEIKSNMEERVTPERVNYILEQYAVPSSIAPLFFFDGEKLTDRLAQNNQDFVKKGLYQLCGIDLLNSVIDDLIGPQKYRSICLNEQSIPKNANDEIIKFNNVIASLKPEIDQLNNTIDTKNNLIHNLQKEKEEVMAKIISLTQGDTKTTVEYASALKLAQETKNNKTNLIHKSLGNSLAQALVPYELIKSFVETQTKEIIRLNHDAGKNQAEHRLPDFIQNLRQDSEALRSLGEAALHNPTLEKAIRTAWNSLFNPLPKNCAESIWHTYLNIDAHANIKHSLKNWGTSLPNISQLIKEASSADYEMKKATARLSELENTPIESYVTKNTEIQKQLELELQDFGALNQRIKMRTEQLNRERSQLDSLQRKIAESMPAQLKAKRATTVAECIKAINNKLINSKLSAVGDEATRIFKLIAHDLQVSTISFNEGEIVPKDSKGKTITLGLSAGERQIQVMSILGALGSVSSYMAPIVIDTPLARLDVHHRNNLWKYWSSLPHQVIILAQDSEITPENISDKKANINSVFTIESSSNSIDGYKTAKITSNHYFGNNI